MTIGGLFVGHGTQKLFGWFGGPGMEGTTGMMGKLGMHPPRRQALAAGLSEAIGGALLAAGALMPLAAAMLTGSMATAIRKVHLDKGLWNTAGGYELNLTLVAAAIALVDSGPGAPSGDDALGLELNGNSWALAALAAGVAGSAAAIELGAGCPPRSRRHRRLDASSAVRRASRKAPPPRPRSSPAAPRGASRASGPAGRC
jgi:putative oxidoreductase